MIHLNEAFRRIYGDDPTTLSRQQNRYAKLQAAFRSEFGDYELSWFSCPGRVELGGNHTDHNQGRVLAASINLDSIAVASPNRAKQIVLHSEGYPRPFVVDLSELEPIESEQESTRALIRGICYRFRELGYIIGGFNACISSAVLPGCGLSSSASIEVLIGAILNGLYNDNAIGAQVLAQIGQFAENSYFGKPCGLMDQMACAIGGIIAIDFQDPAKPQINQVNVDFAASGHQLLIVNTGGSHADLTGDYAAVPAEMTAVANALGGKVLRDLEPNRFFDNIPLLRRQLGDRAVLRAIHFFKENERVAYQVEALEDGDFSTFLELVNLSGDSSFKWLQNVLPIRKVADQRIALALALTENFVEVCGAGACRVHGGGFAGTILAFLPKSAIAAYKKRMGPVFGADCLTELEIRNAGVCHLCA